MTELRAEFTALKTTLGSVDPVRLRYIESLLLKAEKSAGALAPVLEGRVREAISDFRDGVSHRRRAAGDAGPGRRQCSGISQLVQLLNTQRDESHDPRDGSLDDALRQQELELVAAIAAEADVPPMAGTSGQDVLRAARSLQRAMVRLNADRAVAQAMADVPPEAGPLNPQRLAARSLHTMKELSPHYLGRFVSYIDTLFWLEQAAKDAQ